MAREGIYVNGKEIIARYVGNRLVWQKETEKLFSTITFTTRWSNYSFDNLTVETTEFTSISSHNDVEINISKISVDNKFWKASKFGYHFRYVRRNTYHLSTRITFQNQNDKEEFLRVVNAKSRVEIKLYQEKK